MILSTLFLSLTPTVFFQDPTETELQTAQRKVAELEAELGPEHLDLVNALDRLMVLNYSQGNYSESEDVCRRILRIMEKAFGQDSLELILFLRNMG
ncbi:MAG: tetratricopeptide repeat protein, partial [Planctomycetota bacterium]|nr:tetratricopeptide repeat protein [Planctomycetota bacterium]